jgi:5'-phosphate synthase pdxT subunit
VSDLVRVGVLALQGDFLEHLEALQNLAERRLIRSSKDLTADGGIDALVLPGGESTTIGRLLEVAGLKSVLVEKIKEGMPTLATCAGAVLLAKRTEGYRRSAQAGTNSSAEPFGKKSRGSSC